MAQMMCTSGGEKKKRPVTVRGAFFDRRRNGIGHFKPSPPPTPLSSECCWPNCRSFMLKRGPAMMLGMCFQARTFPTFLMAGGFYLDIVVCTVVQYIFVQTDYPATLVNRPFLFTSSKKIWALLSPSSYSGTLKGFLPSTLHSFRIPGKK